MRSLEAIPYPLSWRWRQLLKAAANDGGRQVEQDLLLHHVHLFTCSPVHLFTCSPVHLTLKLSMRVINAPLRASRGEGFMPASPPGGAGRGDRTTPEALGLNSD